MKGRREREEGRKEEGKSGKRKREYGSGRKVRGKESG